MKIAYITAGAAGMFCGSCMHDNTLARAMLARGHDVALVPLYTPIRTDEQSVSTEQLFFGGINVYLQQKSGLFRHLPRWMDRWLDAPWLIRWATGRGVSTQAKELGALAVSILSGAEGNQRKEVERLVAWLASDLQPDIVLFTNMLVAGSAPEIKRRLGVPIVVTLQGDDIFLRDLVEPFRAAALAAIARLDEHVAAYLVNSDFYAAAMSEYLRLSREKFRIVPLGIDTRDFASLARSDNNRAPAVGYLARLAPEKGLHVLVDAFQLLKERPGMDNVRLEIGGWLGPQHRQYAQAQFDKLARAKLGGHYRYHGEVDRAQKLQLLQSVDVLSVPTTYREPKGLFVLEALASGVPVVQPAHGAFPEMISATAGGLLVPPEDPAALAEALASLLENETGRRELGEQGRAAVLDRFHADAIADRTLAVLEEVQRTG